MKDPAKYYHNNVYGTLCLLEAMKKYGVNRIVFSTAAAYGEPEHVPILETDRTLPTNTYGEAKLAMEKMMNYPPGCLELAQEAPERLSGTRLNIQSIVPKRDNGQIRNTTLPSMLLTSMGPSVRLSMLTSRLSPITNTL